MEELDIEDAITKVLDSIADTIKESGASIEREIDGWCIGSIFKGKVNNIAIFN